MTDSRETFKGDRPETSDVVLCLHCGETLHAPEDDVFWHETTDHCCPEMKRKAPSREDVDAIANRNNDLFFKAAELADSGMDYLAIEDCVIARNNEFASPLPISEIHSLLAPIRRKLLAASAEGVVGNRPDWKGFTLAIMENWHEHGDIEASEKFELAKKFNIIREIPGGFDPESHTDEIGEAAPGDPWFELNT